MMQLDFEKAITSPFEGNDWIAKTGIYALVQFVVYLITNLLNQLLNISKFVTPYIFGIMNLSSSQTSILSSLITVGIPFLLSMQHNAISIPSFNDCPVIDCLSDEIIFLRQNFLMGH